MDFLFKSADKYLEQSSWKDIAALKVCLLSLGVMVGMMIPESRKKNSGILAATAFAATYIPVMGKYLSVLRSMGHGQDESL